MDEGKMSFCEFVEAGKDMSELHEIAEHGLDFMAIFFRVPAGFALD